MSQTGSGLIALFTRHRTAANLVMVLMILFGVLGLARMNTQFFPTFAVEWVSVSVTWPGASAEDVDSNIVAAIEPEVRFLDGVKRVFSQSVEGIGSIIVEFEPGTNLDTALANVENSVDRVETLPEASEQPVVNRLYFYENIGNIVISGPFSEAALRAAAKDIRERLLAAGVDKVDLFGSRREEIWVEVGEGRLRQPRPHTRRYRVTDQHELDRPALGHRPRWHQQADPKLGPCPIGRRDRPGRDHRARGRGQGPPPRYRDHQRTLQRAGYGRVQGRLPRHRDAGAPSQQLRCAGAGGHTRCFSRGVAADAATDSGRRALRRCVAANRRPHQHAAPQRRERAGLGGARAVHLPKHAGRLLGHGRHSPSRCSPPSA